MQTLRRWHHQGAPIWNAQAPPPKVRKYDRLPVTGTAWTDLWIVSSQLDKTWTHYVDSRTVFCTGPQGGCWLPHEQTGNARFGAWLAVQPHGQAKAYLLRLTGCALACEGRLETLSGSLRGLWLQVRRLHGHSHSEMQCQLVIGDEVPDRLHEEIDVKYQVERMVSAGDRVDGKNAKRAGRSLAELAGVGPHAH